MTSDDIQDVNEQVSNINNKIIELNPLILDYNFNKTLYETAFNACNNANTAYKQKKQIN